MDVVALGELLVDFTYGGKSESGRNLFEQNPGGAPANALSVLSNLGRKTAFIGKVGEDMHGDFLEKALMEKNINVEGLIKDKNVFTTLAFVALTDEGERIFSFGRKPGADTCLLEKELDKHLLEGCKIFHFGSLSLTDEPARGATIAGVEIAKAAGAIISFDPNYRDTLWNDPKEASKAIKSVLKYVDILKVSEEELFLLMEEKDPCTAAKNLLETGAGCVVVTLGAKGAVLVTKDISVAVSGYNCPVVDTTGAGDCFWGTFLHRILSLDKNYENISEEEARAALEFSNASAALCVQRRGGILAMPYLEEIESFMKENKGHDTN